jgi:hypothetical protein
MKKDNLLAIYRDCEFNVAPTDGKVTIEGWKRWQTDRLPVEELCRWGDGTLVNKEGVKWRKDNIEFAVICGERPWTKEPGIVVLDADDAEAMKLVELKCPPTPLKTSTPRGGMHYIYRHPGFRVKQIIKYVFKGKQYNLDRKADGNYVMCPGTQRDGKMYCWNEKWTPQLIRSLPVYDMNWIPEDTPEVVGSEDYNEDYFVSTGFQAAKSWADIFEPAGWEQVTCSEDGYYQQWRRPGGTHKHSGNVKGGSFYCHSSPGPDQPFERGPYGKLRAYAILHCDGDIEKAKAVASEYSYIDPKHIQLVDQIVKGNNED